MQYSNSINIVKTTTTCLVLVKKRPHHQKNQVLKGPLKDLNELLVAVEQLANPHIQDRNSTFIDAVSLYKALKTKHAGKQDIVQTLDCVKMTLNQIYLVQQQLDEIKLKQRDKESIAIKNVFGPDSHHFRI